ncbi:arginine--tRNA ligase [Candidatus Sneabacter namystus]|uniref:Arginine--tRNA ligase n=1 Tax=Candidatus Sneabacter namystus TaxID=2601646 RepID=A0A5C0UIK5_9RICK|nr:arginine--tRNA ligase [Candidatus Sneabacter namystus]QEK39617.1 arginine--tRNA ligase [Candidatus Sneabacter namystus]
MNIFSKIKKEILQFLVSNFEVDLRDIPVNLDSIHSDISTTAAFLCAKQLNQSVKACADVISDHVRTLQDVENVIVSDKGFINITIKIDSWHKELKNIATNDLSYLHPVLSQGNKVNVEYVSANPTGPLHVGHARGAVYGDVLSNAMKVCGFAVTREYYVNDFGNQVNILVSSILSRYKNIALSTNDPIGEGLYPGEYLIPVAQSLYDIYGDKLLDLADIPDDVKRLCIDEMLRIIKNDLHSLGVKHDVFFFESSLHKAHVTDDLISYLVEKSLVYVGSLNKPKGHVVDEDYEQNQPQLLFASSKFGDSQDRTVKKSNGDFTYFGSELAYIKKKVSEGFNDLVVVLGADHVGYVKRMKGAVTALGEGKAKIDVALTQMVKYLKNGVLMPMSKRQGVFASVGELVKLVGKDAIRFMMLSIRHDVELTFDIEKVNEYSSDNPVFYINYAYARSCSVLGKIKKERQLYSEMDESLGRLILSEEILLIRKLSSWPQVLENVVLKKEPHKIVSYLYTLAKEFHALWNLRDDKGQSYRFIVHEDLSLTCARSYLLNGVKNVIKDGCNVMGVTPMERM